MKRWILRSLGAFGLGFTAFVALAAWMLLSAPTGERLPLAAGLLSVESTEGKQLLDESGSADHAALDAAFQPQERRAWCGVASSATVLSAMGTPVSQADVLDDAADEVDGAWQVTMAGMTLDTLAEIIDANGAQADATHAEDSDLDTFRAHVAANLTTPGDYVLVNYDRVTLDQAGGGHISPIGAYHAGSDRFLVMDVAAYKYPPVWVAAEALWASMDTTDPSAGLSRGWVEVRAAR